MGFRFQSEKKKPPWWGTMATGRHRGWNKNLREHILNSKHVAGGGGRTGSIVEL